MLAQRHPQPLAFPHSLGLLVELRFHLTDFGIGDDVDEGDVLAFFEVGARLHRGTVNPSLYLRG